MSRANSYDCYPAFVIRTPLFPLDYINEIPDNYGALFDFIRKEWNDPFVRDALHIASPEFCRLLDKELIKGMLSPGLAFSFIRYYIRMSFRCTPFGMFAGVGSGELSGGVDIRINNPDENLLRGRLDMEFLGAFVQKLMGENDVISQLNYKANTSLYKAGSSWRFVEVLYHKGSRKKYNITALDSNEVLDNIINRSAMWRRWEEIVNQLIEEGYTEEHASGFIKELIQSQVLVPDIFPNLTGSEFSHQLRARLDEFSGKPGIIKDFIDLESGVNEILQPGRFYRKSGAIGALASSIVPGLNLSRLIQFDMLVSYNSCKVSKDLSNRVLMGIRILKALSGERPSEVLDKFIEYFVDRFDTMEVPLPLVMDSDFGVGLDGPRGQQMNDPGPLLNGLEFPMGIEPVGPKPPHPLLLKKMKSFDPSKSRFIDLDKPDIGKLGIRKGDWPDQMYAMCKLSGKDNLQSNIDMASAGNPAFLLGRFGFLEDGVGIDQHIRQLIKDDIDNHPDEILAEIVHLPEDRTGNILQRPSYYDWEIDYLANPGDGARVINPGEILVSVVGDKIVLKHRKSGKKIIPRLTNAHNYRGMQLPLYQFLCELARHESGSGYFPNWGWLAGLYDFLPGIRYGSLVLSQPRWRLKLNDEIMRIKDHGQLYEKILFWVKENGLPNKVIWSRGDHELLIDWSNINVVMASWENIRKNKYVTFRHYPYDAGSPVQGEDGVYSNEVLMSFKKTRE